MAWMNLTNVFSEIINERNEKQSDSTVRLLLNDILMYGKTNTIL